MIRIDWVWLAVTGGVVILTYLVGITALLMAVGWLSHVADGGDTAARMREAIDPAGINAENTAVLRANYLRMSDEDRTDLERAFRDALALFDGVPHVKGNEGDN